MCIICSVHGEFWQTPKDHIRGHGCSKCRYDNNSKKRRLTLDDFIKKAINVHGDRYDYTKTNYINSRTKICITCPIHGDFYMLPSLHLNGQNCPKCSHGSILKTTEQFINEAKEVHRR